ncbi:MAG TPA: hypothetical protein VG826_21665 [Pirellulales bacterium]|nr:hypothetical protein [Pirellulales bacterium]
MQDKEPFQEPGCLRLGLQLIGAAAWLAVIAAILTGLSRNSFLVMYAATVCGALATSALALMWLLPWAMNTEAPRKQFRLASAFYFMTLVAVYLAAIRWVVVQVERQMAQEGVRESLPWQAVMAMGAGVTLFLVITYPWVLRLAESLMWLAVWIVRWPPARRCLKFCLRRK